MQSFLYGLGIAVFVLVLTGPLAVSIFIRLARTGHRRWLWVFWTTLALMTVLLGITIAYTFGDFFPGWGCLASLLTPLVAVVTILVARFQIRRLGGFMGDDHALRRWLLVGAWIIPLLQLSAPVIGFGYARTCDALNREAAGPIISALREYRAATGSYPILQSPYQSDLGLLVPRYLPITPQRACVLDIIPGTAPRYPLGDDWSLYYCSNSPGTETLLLVPILGSDAQQVYNLSTGKWSVGGALDGYCSYLR